MAGHFKAPEHRRTERFNLRFTLDEMTHIDAQAAAAGIDPSKYLRRRALGYIVPPAHRIDPGLVSELNRIWVELRAQGNNLNQMARHLNSGQPAIAEIDLVLAELRGVLSKVIDSLEEGSVP